MTTRFPQMKATVVADTKARTVAVTVEHAMAQSYSRAVIPKAKKEFKAWVRENIVFGQLRLVRCDWDNELVADDRASSTIHFSY